MKKRIIFLFLLIGLTLFLLSGCRTDSSTQSEISTGSAGEPVISGLHFISSMELSYAKCFRIYQYENGYDVITVSDGRNYLVVPEGGKIPKGTSKFIILQKPLKNIYLAATSTMSLFCALDGLDQVRLSGARQDEWYVPQAVKAMEDKKILYAGKYSEPDFEMLVSEKCNLAIESTMILHTPEVKEKIEELGIPVLIDRSSYEPHPLGRTEWIKLYGILLDRENQADTLFKKQADIVESLSDFPNTEKTVAFFYVTNSGAVAVRKSSDYLATMIELAGGRYIFKNLGDPNSATSGVTMPMEDFYAAAKDADYLIYNAAIDTPMETIDQLLAKSRLFADFKAVKNGNVWCTGKYLYQATDILGSMISNIHTMLTEDDETDLTFIHKLK